MKHNDGAVSVYCMSHLYCAYPVALRLMRIPVEEYASY
jgi:hypothetical protein